MARSKYDIFISYRRTAYDTENLIAEKLRHAGMGRPLMWTCRHDVVVMREILES